MKKTLMTLALLAAGGFAAPAMAADCAITVEGNDQMQFNTTLIRVKAGEPVELTLKNVGTQPKEAMGHNLVILKPGVDIATFGGEAVGAADVRADTDPEVTVDVDVAVVRALEGPVGAPR